MADTKALREALVDCLDTTIPESERADARDVILDALSGLLDDLDKLREDADVTHAAWQADKDLLNARAEKAEAERDEALRKQRIDQEQCDHVTAEAAQMADDLASLAEKERQKDTDLMHALQREDELRTDLADLHKKMADAEIAAWDKGFEVGCHEGGRHVMQRLKETEADLAALREVAQASVAAIPPCPCCGEQWVCAADCTFRHDAYEAYVIQRDRRELLSALHSILSPDPDTEPKT